jgi:flagellar hook-length control protein FliK
VDPGAAAAPALSSTAAGLARLGAAMATGQDGDHLAPSGLDLQRVQAQVLRQLLPRVESPPPDGPAVTLRLEPEHLGKVTLQITPRGDRLLIEFQAESAEAGAALREGRHELARALAAQTGRWQHVEVRVAEAEGAAANQDDHDDEGSEPEGRRDRDPEHQGRRRGHR